VRKLAKQDETAAQFYEDPANLEPMGTPHRVARENLRLASHVPIRFSATTIAKVKNLAEEDGLTVSSWIRRLAEREVERRLSARNQTLLSVQVPLRIEFEKPTSVTVNESLVAKAS
jgi:predicted DNA binding CopG/RHH family protein